MVRANGIEPQYQYLVSEVIMLRLFAILESTLADIAFKLACGTTYTNGTVPNTHVKCKSINDAYLKMLSYNRSKPKQYLKWTKTTFIKDSIEKVIDINDPYYTQVQIHGSILDEMRIVRNHIAHRSKDTMRDYRILLRIKFGANIKLQIGAFLTSTKRHSRPLVEQYILTSKIILNDITNG